MQKLVGQIAFVTGAGRGFGHAIAMRLAQQGAAVALVSRTLSQLHEVTAAINDSGGRAHPVAADLSDPKQVVAACAEVKDVLGSPTLLVSNAGIPGPFGPVWAVDAEKWWHAESIHIRAPLLLMRQLVPDMIARGSGRVIVTSAIASKITLNCLSAYSVGKAAVNKLVEVAAAEAAEHNVQFFAVEPGFVVTQLAEDTYNDPDARKYMPHMLKYLEDGRKRANPLADLGRTAERCVRLASGEYDVLSGRFMELDDPIDEWKQAALAK